LKDANWKKKYGCAMVNEAKIESGGKQEHNLIRTEELIIRPFCRVDNKLAKVKKATTGRPLQGLVTLDGSVLAERALTPAAYLVAALAAPAQGALHLLRVVDIPVCYGKGRSQANVGMKMIEQADLGIAMYYGSQVALRAAVPAW
jgi:hypothetical protein